MYEEIGTKIKGMAKALFVLCTVVSIIVAIVMFGEASDSYSHEEEYLGLGFTYLLGVPLLSLFLSWIIFGFGELIEKVTAIAEKTSSTEPISKIDSQFNLSEKSSQTKPISKNTDETNISKTTELSVLEDLLHRKLISEEEYYDLSHKI